MRKCKQHRRDVKGMEQHFGITSVSFEKQKRDMICSGVYAGSFCTSIF